MLLFPRKTSIAIRVIFFVVIVTTAAMIAAGFIGYRTERRLMQDDLEHDETNLADHLAVALTLPVWNFDREQIERILEGAMRQDIVERLAVRLVDQNGTAFLKARGGAGAGSVAGRRITLGRTISFNGETLGTVEVQATTDLMERKLRSYLLSMILLGAVIDVVLVAGLYFLLWKTVLQPLREIEGYATSRSRGGREAAAWDVRHYRGELESLRHALEAMIGQLDARHAELQSASARLEAEKTKLQTLFSILPTGISITDEQRNVLQMNPALERLLGFSLEEIIGGRHGLRTYHNQDGGTILADDMPSARAMREQGPVLDQQIMISKEDGSSLWVSVSAAPLPGYGAAVTTTDITDRKLAEQHLIQQLEELQRWQKVTLGREERVRQLKAEINELCRRTGLSPRYRSQTDTSSSAPDSQGRGA